MLAHCVPEPGKICPNQATYNVWFEGFGGLYGYMCNEHVSKAIIEGVNGYKVSQITALKEDSQYPVPVFLTRREVDR